MMEDAILSDRPNMTQLQMISQEEMWTQIFQDMSLIQTDVKSSDFKIIEANTGCL